MALLGFLKYLGRRDEDTKEFVSYANLNNALLGRDSTSAFLHSAIRSCVERIISRALPAEFTSSDKSKQRILDNPLGQGKFGKIAFYRSLYEQLLIDGNAFVYRTVSSDRENAGGRRVAISSGTEYLPQVKKWRVQKRINQQQMSIMSADNEGLITHFYLGYKEGDEHHKVQSPIQAIERALLLHDSTRNLLIDYAQKGHKLGGLFKGTPGVSTADRPQLKSDYQDLNKDLTKLKRNYSIMAAPPEIEYMPIPKVAPPTMEALDMALQEIARVYGVPMEMLQARKERTDYSNVDDHLMSDAVFPMLDMVCDGLSRHLKTEVTVKPFTAFRAVLGSASKHITNLAQTTVPTVNELRALLRYPPVSWGNEPPQPAGAGYNQNKSDENGRPKKGMGANSKANENK